VDRLCTPWRFAYVSGQAKQEGCVFCRILREPDDETYVLHRGEHWYIVLNRYPYSPGHLMVSPYRHTDSPEKLTEEERNEHFDIVSRCVEVLRQEFNPEGFNLGINLGKVAGAGIDDHVHTHIVPRYQGDTNFMTVISDVRVVPEALAETYEKLKGKF